MSRQRKKRLKIGNKAISKDEPVFIITEVGSTFNALDEALKIIREVNNHETD